MKKTSLIFIFLIFISSLLYGEDLLEEEKKFLIQSADIVKNEFKIREEKYLKEIDFLKSEIENLEKDLKIKNTQPELLEKFQSEKNKTKEIEDSVQKIQFFFQETKTFKKEIERFFSNSSKFFKFEYNSKQIIMNGYLGGVYKSGKEYGYVKIDDKELVFIQEKINSQKIENIFNNNSAYFPLCFGKGRKMEPGFIESVLVYIQKGGVMIYPILLIGFAGIILTLFQGFILFYMKIPKEKKEKEFFENLENKFVKSFKRYPSLKFYKKLYLKEKGSFSDEIINSLLEREIKKLEKFNPTIAVLAGIAPLIGLLGTVTGMITTFNSAGGAGSVKAAEMAGGISEALLTTQLGLSIALPLMIFHHFFEQRLDQFVFDLDEKKNIFMAKLRKK
ncbi:MAG: MotA/TolQ/ExbB proton channel family protein [Desulforegulaceae bacterium]|nr:MotA/TolQ/ExbB proton channel family protein [Desulforegulaceae bacterium]